MFPSAHTVRLVFPVLILLVATAAGQGAYKPGEPVPDFAFDQLVGGDGRKKLSDFRGRVVLGCWWQDVYSGMEAARAAVKLEEKHKKKGLTIVLLSQQKWDSPDGAPERAFLHKTFKGHNALVGSLTRHPFRLSGDPPHWFVVGADGNLGGCGAYKSTGGKIEKIVKRELSKRKKGWGDNATRRKVRQLAYVKDRLGEAWTAIGSAGDDELRKEVQDHFDGRIRRLAALIDGGDLVRAQESLASLAKGAANVKLFKEKTDELSGRLETDEARAALELDRKLRKLSKAIIAGKATPALARKIEALAKSATSEPLAARARELARVARAMSR